MWNHPDGVESPIGGAGPGICTCFSFVRYVCASVCWDVYIDSGMCTSCSAFVSGMLGIFQSLLMYRLIT